MKTIIFSAILFCTIAMPTLAELTPQDLDKIRLIVKEEIEEEIKPIKAEVVAVKAEVESLKIDVSWIRGRLEGIDEQFEGVNKQIAHVTYVTYGLIALIVASYRYPTNHHGVAERKGSRTRKNKSRTQTGNRST